VAGLAEALGLRVPRRVLVVIGDAVQVEDPDPEVVHLLRASHGVNLGFEILENARDLRPEDIERITHDDASTIAWLDWLVMNPDRTVRNPNLLVRKGELWLIDHGAALVFHHDWRAVTEESPRRRAPALSSHVLRERVADLAAWDLVLAERLDRDAIMACVQSVPDAFLSPLLATTTTPSGLARRRQAYAAFLWKRLKSPRLVAQSLWGD
jgi:hypothetical protein